ncbi:MAG: TrkH family potassium uptake protein [Magnetospirillum sp.]|nr:TrkH family potassium uptake protein [Magnetospirillum sp.]
MIDVRPVLFVIGILLMVLATAMGLPALVDYVGGDRDWRVFAASAVVTAFIGLIFTLGSRIEGRFSLSSRQAFLLTASAWASTALMGALPFAFSALDLSLTDAVFEATSGITTTGSTVIVGLDRAPKGILLWRALLNWLGGIGIVVLAIAVLPLLRIGGMQLFRMETSDKNNRVRPRVTQVAWSIGAVYLAFTAAAGLALWLTGMTPFDALCHALAALSTGGFSTADASLAHWGAATQWVTILAMILGGSTFTLFVAPWKRDGWPFLHDSQMRWYLGFLGFFSVLVGLWQWASTDMPVDEALRHATFSVVSVTTTSGFASTDYNAWGGFAQTVFFILVFIGGCTGSPAGAIKVFRWEMLFKLAGVHLKRLVHPHGVFIIDFNRQPVSEAVIKSVLGFVVMYFLTFSVFALALTTAGTDVVTALSGSAQALGNAGRGLGEVIGPAGSFKPLSDAAKWLLSAEMLLGRLELFTVFVLFTRAFWRE